MMYEGVNMMKEDDKKYLQEEITKSHAAILDILAGVDLEMYVYKDTDWRIRDVLGHIATWDGEVTKSLRSFLKGTEYFIADIDEDETDFNEQAVSKQRKLSTQQIVAEWEKAREDLKTALGDIPVDKFPGELRYPWGDEGGSIPKLVEFTVEHDEEHKDEIVKAVQAQQKK
jgi:hypothetical protein